MKKSYTILLLGVLALGPIARAATLTVTTTASSGAGSLNAAITALNNGDTVAFNIPGAGPHYISPPLGGFPLITKTGVTIDGYTQPGSSVNTNPILAANNASIKIVLRAADGNFTDLTALMVNGFTDGEQAILAAIGATNFTVRGLCFLGDWTDSGSSLSEYGIALGGNATAINPHISGCRFGLDPDNITVGRLKDGIAYFGAGVQNLTIGVAAGPANAAVARAQFNIFVGMYIAFIGDGGPVRASGNFFNVYPDGLHDYTVDSGDGNVGHSMEAVFEMGGNNTGVIGTDGDGLNDAEERNIFGGATGAGDSRIMEWYGGSPTNTIIAGNYIGVAVDGITRFTNGGPTMELFESLKSVNIAQIGSDFDGVSDALEGNIISWNYPFSTLYPDPATATLSGKWRFGKIDVGAAVSLRGNQMLGNNPAPYSFVPGDFDSGRVANYGTYVSTFMVPTGDYTTYVPILSPTNIFPTLTGTFSPGLNPYTNIIIDVYQLDPEGWANGQLFGFPELVNPDGRTNGFAQGKKYLGSFGVANTGTFSINLSSFDLGPGAITATANYSASPAGTHRAKTFTSNFSNPTALIPGGAESVGLARIVPDTIVWFSASQARPKIGGFVVGDDVQNGGAVEATAGVLGDSTFLLASSMKASDGVSMRFSSVYQPAAGGAPKLGDLFYADNGVPYTNKINESRQDGNPGRVAGDPRYGAVNFIGAGEVSLWAYPSFFNSDGRFRTTLPLYADMAANSAREAAIQTYTLNPTTLSQTMLAKAQDSAFGGLTNSAPVAVGQNQLSRTGGTVVGLDNGNFVSVVEDRSKLFNADGNASTATIFAPNGSIVKAAFKVANADQWANVGAFKGGFYVRPSGGLIYFFDNSGNLQGSLNHNISAGLSFDNGRGDGTRTTSDIRSHYVFMAGRSPDNAVGPVWLAVFDANTRTFVTKATVSD
ncbi:MAG: hypothetical protein ABIQ35_12215, partial [Verrucomicrobiota bacterium]